MYIIVHIIVASIHFHEATIFVTKQIKIEEGKVFVSRKQ